MTRNGGAPSLQSIRELLAYNDKAVGRALVALHRRQTEDEQGMLCTKHQNGRGFNQADGGKGSLDAMHFIRHGQLWRADIAFWRARQGNTTRIGKYAGQLLEIALERWAARQLGVLE